MCRHSLTSRVPLQIRLAVHRAAVMRSVQIRVVWEAAIFLEMTGGNVETAVEIFLSSQGGKQFAA